MLEGEGRPFLLKRLDSLREVPGCPAGRRRRKAGFDPRQGRLQPFENGFNGATKLGEPLPGQSASLKCSRWLPSPCFKPAGELLKLAPKTRRRFQLSLVGKP